MHNPDRRIKETVIAQKLMKKSEDKFEQIEDQS